MDIYLKDGIINLQNIHDYDNKSKRWETKGDLVYDNGSRLKIWNNSSAVGGGTGKNVIHTKDIDFGAPAIRKKI